MTPWHPSTFRVVTYLHPDGWEAFRPTDREAQSYFFWGMRNGYIRRVPVVTRRTWQAVETGRYALVDETPMVLRRLTQ